jgi:hypothetical protein
MEKLRKEDLSIHHYIRYNILNEYIETDSNVPLTYKSNISDNTSKVYEATSSRTPSPVAIGRGWVYLDAYGDTTEQQSAVTVYDESSNTISGTKYMVDYVDGRIITSGTLSPAPAAVTYKYFYVSLVADWEHIEAAGAPVVVIDIHGFEKEGFQLGGGQRVPRRGYLHIFASSRSERDDLSDLLYDGIYNKSCPNQDWSKGTILDWDGSFNTAYIYSTINNSSSIWFENVRARTITPPLAGGIPRTDLTMLSDLNRYRARIDFNMFYWKEA